MTLRILIVDDREVVRNELRNVLSLYDSVLIVGEAADGWDAVRQAKTLNPDIVLMDLEMPGLDGFEATRKIKAAHLAHSVIVFSVYADEVSQVKALEAGADAFMVKGTNLATLVDLCKQLIFQTEVDQPNGGGGKILKGDCLLENNDLMENAGKNITRNFNKS